MFMLGCLFPFCVVEGPALGMRSPVLKIYPKQALLPNIHCSNKPCRGERSWLPLYYIHWGEGLSVSQPVLREGYQGGY